MTQSPDTIWEAIEGGHVRQEQLVDQLEMELEDAVNRKDEHGRALATARMTAELDDSLRATDRKSWAERQDDVMDTKLEADLAAGRVKVTEVRLTVLKDQLGRLQSAFVSRRTTP